MNKFHKYLIIIGFFGLTIFLRQSLDSENQETKESKIFKVIGESMLPTFTPGQMVEYIENNGNLQFKRGDLILPFIEGRGVTSIRRIIGLPGETIKIENGNVNICDSLNNCSVLEESYILGITKVSCEKNEYILGSGYFIMGDNRENSTDSRCCYSLDCTGEKKFSNPIQYEFTSKQIIGKIIE